MFKISKSNVSFSKLKINSEKLRVLNQEQLSHALGGLQCSSEDSSRFHATETNERPIA